MDSLSKGQQITDAFRYVQQVFNECKRLFLKIDNQLAPQWSSVFGNIITRDVSKSLQDSDRWILEALFRFYQDSSDPKSNKVITISFWGEVDQPVITVGKIIYTDLSQRSHWDLWKIWFEWVDNNEKNNYELDGNINIFSSKDCSYIKEAQVFSIPLISITDDEALMEKIIKPLKAL